MSDSVDRVFVHALATVRRLPRTGSSRPPPAARLRLYGLYKQSMEGDVSAIVPRPSLPISSPDPATANTVHRYASRDLRTREAQAEIEKWDAWHACAGMSRTDAKRQYISTLIDTMKEYASGTAESRELVGELEFVWSQIKEQTGSEPDNSSPGQSHNGGSRGSGQEQESPTRKLERAGMALGSVRRDSQMGSMSFSSNRPSVGSLEASGFGKSVSGSGDGGDKRRTRLKRTESGLRVLSPVSQGDEDSVVEGVDEEENDPEARYEDADEGEEGEEQPLDTAPSSPLGDRRRSQPVDAPAPADQDLATWQRNLEAHLHALKTEIAALREQLSANHLLSSSTYSLGGAYYTLTTTQRILHRAKHYIRTLGALCFQQLVVQLGILVVVLLLGRIRGDLRIEMWVRDVLVRMRKKFRGIFGGLAYWLMDVFGRGGRLSFVGRILRII